jgi:hypothetical protein
MPSGNGWSITGIADPLTDGRSREVSKIISVDNVGCIDGVFLIIVGSNVGEAVGAFDIGVGLYVGETVGALVKT